MTKAGAGETRKAEEKETLSRKTEAALSEDPEGSLMTSGQHYPRSKIVRFQVKSMELRELQKKVKKFKQSQAPSQKGSTHQRA